MRILLVSDSHGHKQKLQMIISKYIEELDMVIHLGDIVKDVLYLIKQFGESHLKFEYVRGNNDWEKDVPLEKVLYIQDKKILITHGHLYSVKMGYSRIIQYGKSKGVDAVFFGHTHQAEEFFIDDMLCLNPGSTLLPQGGENPTCCLVDIFEGKISTKFINSNSIF